MKSKGFTLIEVLGVIVILAVIITLVFPSVDKTINKSKNITYKSQINSMLNAAYDYTLENTKVLPETSKNISYVTLGELMSLGYLDNNLINPKTKKEFSYDLVVKISKVSNEYKVSDEYSKKSGEYLYTVLIDGTSFVNKPTIKFDGILANSDGNYITNVSLNGEFTDVTYSATTKDGVLITDKVVKYIIHDNEVVDSVDTSHLGIYYINYIVVDDDGNSNRVVRSVIVKDEEAPVLTVYDPKTISLNDTSYDLMNGVSCTDNSGMCDIKMEGSVDFSKKGKYVITFIAIDPSNNQARKSVTITVE